MADAIRFYRVFFDMRSTLDAEDIIARLDRGFVTACIDDPSGRRLACDLAFYPPAPQVAKMNWKTFTGTLNAGWSWALLNPSFLRAIKPSGHNGPPRLLVTMGGADPEGMIYTVLDGLMRVRSECEIHIVLGHCFSDREGVQKRCECLPMPVVIHENVQNMAQLMSTIDLAVASFGVTAY